MKKAILGILMLTALPATSYAQQAPEPYRVKVILNYCGDTITESTAELIEDQFYRIPLLRRTFIRASYTAVITTGDAQRHDGYCTNLSEAVKEIRKKGR